MPTAPRTVRSAPSTTPRSSPKPGDTVIVHGGEYREWVRPRRGGLSDQRRITYTAAPGEHVVIKGSEPVTGWERVDGNVWTVAVPNTLFGSFNPFAEEIDGDWIVYADAVSPKKHLGDVYLNGTSFYEVDLTDVSRPAAAHRGDRRLDRDSRPASATRSRRGWSGTPKSRTTRRRSGPTSRARTRTRNSSRSTCAAPSSTRPSTTSTTSPSAGSSWPRPPARGPRRPPTSPGLIGPNWAKGWIIEDNVIHDAKCSAISIGKEISTGHNYATLRRDKPGYQYQLESVFAARQIGWDREHVGSHIVRRNTIYDCGQNGIVGHLGCVFSTIEDNHIYNIALKREFYGYEIAGIKLHAAIDVIIRHNRIHDCSLGTWLDWQTQGTRVSRNLLYDNNRDLFVEVSHGPYLVEHNIFASPASLELFSQGGAFVNNLVCGTVFLEPVLERPTPYHVPHSTQVAGYAAIHGGDDRHIGNIFLGGDAGRGLRTDGTTGPAEPTTAPSATTAIPHRWRTTSPWSTTPPVATTNDSWASSNRSTSTTTSTPAERDRSRPSTAPSSSPAATCVATIVDEGAEVYLESRLPAEFDSVRLGVITGSDLERVRFVDAEFEEPDGSPAVLATDLVGAEKTRTGSYPAGPITALASGGARTRVWSAHRSTR